MLYNFLTKEQCQDILTSVGDPNDEDWEDTRNSLKAEYEGFFYKWKFFNFHSFNNTSLNHYSNLLYNFFPKVTNLYIYRLRVRILYFKKGENLPLHNFNYKRIKSYNKFEKFLKECDFHGYLFLNSVEGSDIFYNGSKLDVKAGSLLFVNIHDKCKITTLNDDLFIMMLHIQTKTKLYAI